MFRTVRDSSGARFRYFDGSDHELMAIPDGTRQDHEDYEPTQETTTPPKLNTASEAKAFTDSVSALVRSGMSRQEAVRTVATTAPTVHQSFIESTNNRGAAVSQVDAQAFVQTFNTLVKAEMTRSGCSRRDAAARVARREPALHEKYVRATNRTSAAY